MKLIAVGATALALSLVTTGCSRGSGSKAAAASNTGGSSAAVAGGAAASSAGTAPTSAAGAAPASVAGAAPTSGSAGGAGSSAASGGTAAPVAVCTALPTAQVASLSGVALTHSREQDAAELNAYTCDYFTDSGVGGMSITVTTANAATVYANSLSTDTIEGAAENVTPVTGLGDKAFSAHDGLRALFGDRLIYVAGLASVPMAESVVKATQAKLG